MDRHILVVLTNPVEGKEEEYNDWYTNTHLKDVLSIPGFVAAQRFKLYDEQLAAGTPYRYMAIYEVESDDIQAAMAELVKATERGDISISSALDTEALASWMFTPITPKLGEP